MQTYVWHDGKLFFVSTIERASSSAYGPERYNETMVWECNPETRERHESFILQDEDGKGCIGTHQRICSDIYRSGEPPKND
jgi:hypothetical protein